MPFVLPWPLAIHADSSTKALHQTHVTRSPRGFAVGKARSWGSRAPSSGPASRGLSILSAGGTSPTPALTPLATSPSSRWLETQRAAVSNAPQRPRAGVGEGKQMAQRCPARRAAWRKVSVCLGHGHELVTETWLESSHRHPPPPPQLPPSAGSR